MNNVTLSQFWCVLGRRIRIFFQFGAARVAEGIRQWAADPFRSVQIRPMALNMS